jgi:N-acyl-D-aspartate/D-glutamate deacylase
MCPSRPTAVSRGSDALMGLARPPLGGGSGGFRRWRPSARGFSGGRPLRRRSSAICAREHWVLSVEEAVHHLTQVPARLYGLRGRGTVAPGDHADLVLFDEASIGPGPLHTRHDLPAGAGRLYAEPTGIARVLVSGATVAVDGQVTGSSPVACCARGSTRRPRRCPRRGRSSKG